MGPALSAPQTPAAWGSFGVGVFFIVATGVFLTSGTLATGLELGLTAMALTLGLATVFVVLWRRVAGVTSYERS